MKSNAPWSVKGIERDARETAKEAARREGMTVGEWLNQVIYTAGDPETSNGEIEGLKTSDLVAAIEHLNKRVIGAESKSVAALDDLGRNFGGIVERLQRLERLKPGGAAGPALEERLQKLEAKSGDRQRIEALKALERAVGQVALQFDSAQKNSQARIESTEKQLQQLAARFDGGEEGSAQNGPAVSQLQDTIEGLTARIARAELIASEASTLKAQSAESVDAEFVERTGARLRVLGDEIKRGGDQIRSLEGSIHKFSEQIDAAERRSSEGVQKVAETISELRTQFAQTDNDAPSDPRQEIEAAVAEATQRTEDKIAALQRSFEAMISRLDVPEDAALGDAKPLSALPGTPGADDAANAGDNIGFGANMGRDALADAEAADDDEEEPFSSFDLDAEIEAQDEAEAAEDDDRAATADDDDARDAFEFDLDDEESGDDEASALLREVEDAFESAAPDNAPDAAPAESAAEEGQTPQDGLDAILAELEDREPEAQNRAAAEAAGDALQDADDHVRRDDANADADDADPAPAGAAPTRRKLTPKQRAILAAKIRRKRLAEQGLSLDRAAAPAASAPEPEYADDDDRGERVSLFAKAGGMFKGLRALLPGGGREEEESGSDSDAAAGDFTRRSEEPAPSVRRQVAGDPSMSGSALSNLRAKPLTIALGVSILLAGAALFFLVKDMITGEPAAAPSVPRAAVSDSAPASVADAGEAAQPENLAEAPEAPSQPLTQPRTLYLDSVAKLKSADGDGQTRAAIRGLEQAAALGHPPAQLQLGELYKLGQGVPQDMAQARAWYERAANGGNVLAMHRIGVMSARGQGGPADQEAAIAWFKQASALGLVDSQYNLGALYHPGGDGSSAAVQDAGEAYYWYSLAAKNGDDQAGGLASALASSVPAERRRDLDARVAGWSAQTPDAEANEIAPAS